MWQWPAFGLGSVTDAAMQKESIKGESMNKKNEKPVTAMREAVKSVLMAYCDDECKSHAECGENCHVWKFQDWIDGTGKRRRA
jgi:hypothetical protein